MAAIEKTAVFFVFIAMGLLMKSKLRTNEERDGIKKIILNLALPAAIFMALLGVDIQPDFFLLPLWALALNAALFFGAPYLLPIAGIRRDTRIYRTARLLVPSFAPGLSCFPFLAEYLGEEALARAAMTDLGNKVFVLIVLYIVAMSWHAHVRAAQTRIEGDKIGAFLKMLFTEPVNLFILAALLMISQGYSLVYLPHIIAEPLTRLSALVTPLILLFIGLSVRFKSSELRTITALLLLRAAVVVWIVVLLVSSGLLTMSESTLVALAFGVSACSFWPFAHICAVENKEKDVEAADRTFDTGFAVNLLAVSFPLSTALILLLLSAGHEVVSTSVLVCAAVLLTALGLVLVGKQSDGRRVERQHVPEQRSAERS
ncbi:MAG: permease [Myxococcota bacterium]